MRLRKYFYAYEIILIPSLLSIFKTKSKNKAKYITHSLFTQICKFLIYYLTLIFKVLTIESFCINSLVCLRNKKYRTF